MSHFNHQYRLKSRPTGRVSEAHLQWQQQPIPTIQEGQALVRIIYASLDPTMRIWMTEVDQYMPPVQLGEVMRAMALGRVVASQSTAYKEGDLVYGMPGLQEYAVAEETGANRFTVLPKLPGVPLPAYCSVLGGTGLTAYFGLFDVAQVRSGETVVVSAAAGAVGSVVGQLAGIAGCRAVGIAGGPSKCTWLTQELGFAAAIDYKKAGWQADLEAACPKGIDVNFENVGGELMNSILRRMNLHGRVALCGAIACYNGESIPDIETQTVLMRRLQVRGFIILDYAARFTEALHKMGQWVLEGKLKHRETIVDGLKTAPESLNMLFDGRNMGKLLLRVSPE